MIDGYNIAWEQTVNKDKDLYYYFVDNDINNMLICWKDQETKDWKVTVWKGNKKINTKSRKVKAAKKAAIKLFYSNELWKK